MEYEGSWSGMRKYLEQEMLAESLRGRVRYRCTRYVGMDSDHLFEIFVDGKMVKQFSWETVHDCLERMGLIQKEPSKEGFYWNGFLDAFFTTPMEHRDEYTDREFAEALGMYRNQDIQSSLVSENPIVRMFAVLDRRIGKRTLKKLKDKIHFQPEWLQYFYRLRLGASQKEATP